LGSIAASSTECSIALVPPVQQPSLGIWGGSIGWAAHAIAVLAVAAEMAA